MTPTKPKPVHVAPCYARPTRGPNDSGRWYWMASGRDNQRGENVSFAIGWATRDEAQAALAQAVRREPARRMDHGDPGLERRLWGGARPNSGPKPAAGVARSEKVLVRLTPEEAQAFADLGGPLAPAVRAMALLGLSVYRGAKAVTIPEEEG